MKLPISPPTRGPLFLQWTGHSYRWTPPALPRLGQLPLLLGSTSPRRRALLRHWGLPHRPVAPGEDPPLPHHDGWQAAALSALAKAARVATLHPARLVLAADTVVTYQEHTLGKPANPDEARSMLLLLSGRRHQVYTAFALATRFADVQLHWWETVRTQVTFNTLSPHQIDDYLASGAPFDKAGGYGIQDRASSLVESVRGCYYNVVGLPRRALLHALNQLGWERCPHRFLYAPQAPGGPRKRDLQPS